MQSMRAPHRLVQVTITVMIVLGLAVAQPLAVGADEKLGETAIDAAFDELVPEPPVEEEAPPPAEAAPASSEPAPEAAAPAAEAAPVEQTAAAETGDGSQASETADAGVAAESIAPAATGTDSASNAAGSSGGANETTTLSAQQSVAEESTQATGGDTARDNGSADSAPQGLGASAISNVLAGDPALGADAPIVGSIAPDTAGDELREVTTAQGSNLRAAGENLRPAIAPSRSRANGEPREGDGGTVVVNALEDSGDEGKVAQHGHIVAGTLCDGSQFWSLDGGGTINANGVNLSANGGTAVTDGRGGDDNIAGRGGAAGNGGSAGASADGGIVIVDSLVTGNNTGNQVSVGDQSFGGDCGQGVIDGGDVTTISNVNISADGGTAIGDASGGDNNIAGNGGAAGNGGTARASADGGLVIVGDLILGNNEGNQVNVGSTGSTGSGGSGVSGGCLVDGGSVINEANIDISADGGIAIADASGGDDNIALGDDAAAGNGGRARADADGGFILAGDIITGNNQGNTIDATCGGSGSGAGGTVVYGGDILNQTTLTLSADGGTAIADAAGDDNNIAVGGNAGDASAGNGGRAVSNAVGGVIWVGNIVTGNNVGNVIAIGANFAPVPDRDGPDKKETPIRTIKKGYAAPSKPGARTTTKAGGRVSARAAGRLAPSARVRRAPAGRRAQAVGKLPNTGTGPANRAAAQASAAPMAPNYVVIEPTAENLAARKRRRSYTRMVEADSPARGRRL
ncbi:MAG: hypothetical protein H0V24_12015 [Chloroflexia bacterium]|nr:hypothetical protein [Chloroflexia bacterium]